MTENGNGLVMPVAPMYGNGGMGGGFGGWGSDIWLILIVLFALGGFGGWGGMGMGGFGGMMGMGMMDGMFLYPWMNQAEITSDGFRDQMLNNNVTSIRDSIGNLSTQLCGCCADVQQSLCNGFAGVNSTINSGFANAETAANARQIANMQQAYSGQIATLQGFNGVQGQIAQASADNRLGIAGLGSDLAREACATRANDTQNTQSILNVINGGIQSIKDQLCQDKIDAKNDEINQLRQEVLYARGQASQVAQNSAIINGVYDRLSQCPVGSTPVYGNTPIFQCPQTVNSCGCGCGNNF